MQNHLSSPKKRIIIFLHMGGYLNIPKPLTTPPPPPSPQLPPPPPPQKPNDPMLYYGLVVVATAALVLAVYNLIIVRWCATQYHRRSQQETHLPRRTQYPTTTATSPLAGGGSTVFLVSSFKYNKRTEKNQLDDDVSECSVCLSVFEEGEEVRKLPTCDHYFHALCIDMWLHSHIDCPLCRAPVVAPPSSLPSAAANI
ncbi:hypothetical protein L6452_21474 [Arctium lappa]|uniref:Uncharacterized protein n=1 Tax=Arctium lappa TaxID=4217 RepID=A0ACB9AXT7_ARCLA|nr:hypothetical protein L6452_21474 [Arctium lappa]